MNRDSVVGNDLNTLQHMELDWTLEATFTTLCSKGIRLVQDMMCRHDNVWRKRRCSCGQVFWM